MDVPDPEDVGPRAELDGALLGPLAAGLGIGRVIAATDQGGTFNLNLRLTTTTGDYVLRVHRPWVTPERLARVQHVRKVLADSGLPVPVPITPPAGATPPTWQGRLVEVERYVPHDGFADSWDRYAVAFSALGSLHDRLSETVDAASFIPPRVRNYGTPDELLGWTQQAERAIRHAEPGPQTAGALTICAAAKALLSAMQEGWHETGSSLPVQLTHGDYGGQNLLFAGQRIVAILDFDFLSYVERIYELAYSLYWMFVRLEADPEPSTWAWRRARELLVRYDAATARPLTSGERRALPIEMARVPLYWVAEAAFVSDPVQAVGRMADGVRLSRWLFNQRDEIRHRL